MARLRSWGVRTLSYAGRAQLVNSVLLNLHSYWASIFVLPKRVLDSVIAVCRNYLLDGKATSSRSPLIAWDLICRDKKMGGLGYKESHTWNIALLGKFVWNIANKTDNLWVKWIDHVYLKGRDWKQYVRSSNVSWYWRQLTHVKDRFRSGFSGDKWVFDKNGYSTLSGYKWLRTGQREVEWDKWVWNKLNIPKHSFLSWIIMWQRLNTRDRLRKIGLDVPSECPLCGKLPETAEHIFLHCEYSQRCRQMLEQKLQVRAQGSDLSQFSNWLHKPVAGSVRSQVVQCVFLSFLYHVWWQRNQAIWQGCIARHKRVVEQIITEAYWRIISVLPKKTSNRDRIWIRDILS